MTNQPHAQAAPADGGEPDPYPLLVEFFKALGEPARLRIAGLLAGEALPAAEIGRRAQTGTAAALKHLARLQAAGLVTAEGEGAQARYRLNEARLRELSGTLLDSPRARALAGATDERSRVLASFFRDGRLIQWPMGDKRQLIILEEIARSFESGRVYSEREVNEILKDFYHDYATIRRGLVERVFLNRHKGVYWVGEGRRIAAGEDEPTPRPPAGEA